MLNTRTFLALLAGTCTTCASYASDDHGHAPAKDDHAPAAEKHDADKPGAPAESAKPKRRPAKLKSSAKDEDSKTNAAHAGTDERGKSESTPHAKADDADAHAARTIEKSSSDESAAKAVPAVTPATHTSAISAEDALKLLVEGNQRWATSSSQNPNCDNEQRSEQAHGQTPAVTVLACADSRIPVERVFDRGVGEIFTVRVAGNVAGDREIGTIEYGLGHLHTKLLVVMGHTKCGAVKACVDGAHNGALHGKVRELVASIEPAVDRAKRNNPDADASEVVNLAVRENVWQGVYNLMTGSAEIRELVSKGDVKVVGAVYDIQSGKVEFLGEHPWQNELLAALNRQDNSVNQPATAAALEPETKSGH